MKILRNEPLNRHTSFNIGGSAQYFCEPSNQKEIFEAIRFAKEHEVKVAVIGYGTNLLIDDAGFNGLVIKIGPKLSFINISSQKIMVGSGMSTNRLITRLANRGLSGIEFMAGIPGSIGGAVVMNAGAWGKAIGKYVESVTVVNHLGKTVIITPKQLRFAYRSSSLQRRKYIVVAVTLKLKKKKMSEILSLVREYLKLRRNKHPINYPNCGSVFKNPHGQKNSRPAGQLIEAADCKGLKVGKAMVSMQHANFIVNLGGATAKDVKALMRKVKSAVWKRFKIKLEPEVKTMVEFFRG